MSSSSSSSSSAGGGGGGGGGGGASASSSATSEVLASELRCNACWRVCNATSQSSFRTRCSHLFCEPCARAFFARRLVCPVCDAGCDGEAGILRLPHAHGLDVMTIVFAFAASHPEDALGVVAEGIKFNREQIALSGTREIFVRSKLHEALEAKSAAAAAAAAALRAQLDEASAAVAASRNKLRETSAQLTEVRRMYTALRSATGGGGDGGGGGGGGAGGVAPFSRLLATPALLPPPRTPDRGGSSHDVLPVSTFAATSTAAGYPASSSSSSAAAGSLPPQRPQLGPAASQLFATASQHAQQQQQQQQQLQLQHQQQQRQLGGAYRDELADYGTQHGGGGGMLTLTSPFAGGGGGGSAGGAAHVLDVGVRPVRPGSSGPGAPRAGGLLPQRTAAAAEAAASTIAGVLRPGDRAPARNIATPMLHGGSLVRTVRGEVRLTQQQQQQQQRQPGGGHGGGAGGPRGGDEY